MGNNESRIRVELDSQIYYSNQSVTGTIHLDLEGKQKCSNVKSIVAVLVGYFSGVVNRQLTILFDFFKTSPITLASSQQTGGLLNFTQGHYSWPFSISLTEYIPPSCYTEIYQVEYVLNITIERSLFHSNINHSQKMTICPHVNLQHIPNQSLIFNNYKENTNEIMLNAKLNKSAYAFGEQIKFKLEIFNTKRLLIKNIQISLYYKFDRQPRGAIIFRPSGLFHTILTNTLPSIENTHEEMISKSFNINLPTTYSPPSFIYTTYIPSHRIPGGYVLAHTPTLSISYSFQINAIIEGILTDVAIIVPITIGTIPQLDEQETQLTATNYPNPIDDTNIRDDRE